MDRDTRSLRACREAPAPAQMVRMQSKDTEMNQEDWGDSGARDRITETSKTLDLNEMMKGMH
jgi:hypothetical protein